MSVYSMTGFAHYQQQTFLGVLNIELKALNSRFLEISCRVPDELKFLESDIRSILSKNIKRGKIDCRLTWEGCAKVEKDLDTDSFNSMLTLQKSILEKLPNARPLSVESILSYPGMLKVKAIDNDLLKEKVMTALTEALIIFNKSRVREGESLASVILKYCDQIESTVRMLQPQLPLIVSSLQQRLENRLQESLEKVLSTNSVLSNEEVRERIRQEVLLYAIKMDVDEEVNRLLTHVNEVRRVLEQGGEVGKKLDFMMQELNREANTLGSKAVAIEMTDASIDLKVTIEKMREQVQNFQ